MKFYIAASLKNAAAVREYAALLKAHGWQQTYDWTENLKAEETQTDLAACAAAEKTGVAGADVLLLLLPGGRGAHTELGMALALGKMVFLCAEKQNAFAPPNDVAFYELPEITKLTGTALQNVQAILQATR